MLLELQNIIKQYETPDESKPLSILNDISLKVDVGESIAIVGPSGSGKSTLLNIMGALDKPTAGAVIFTGRDLASLDEKKLALIRNRDIGFIFQLHHLLPQCTVLENVLVPTLPEVTGIKSEQSIQRANHLLETVGLKERKHYKPAQLSGGERQRAAVVRALINKPKILMADEPTGSLDQASAENLGRLLSEINKQEKVTLILVTHSLELASRMDRRFRLQNGCLIKLRTEANKDLRKRKEF